MATRIVLFDDSRKFRESFAALLDGSGAFILAGAFANADLAVEHIREARPDVVLMDVERPGLKGYEALPAIREAFPELPVLMLTVHDDDDKIFESVCSGASGYLMKGMSPGRILDAVDEVMQGGAPMTPSVACKVLRLVADGGRAAHLPALAISLTPREKEILHLMVEGLSYKMIAAKCDIGFETVRSHIRHIYEKLYVATMTEAVAKAIKEPAGMKGVASDSVGTRPQSDPCTCDAKLHHPER